MLGWVIKSEYAMDHSWWVLCMQGCQRVRKEVCCRCCVPLNTANLCGVGAREGRSLDGVLAELCNATVKHVPLMHVLLQQKRKHVCFDGSLEKGVGRKPPPPSTARS